MYVPVLLFFVCVSTIYAELAVPHGRRIKKHYKTQTVSNSLGLIGKTQEYVDSLTTEQINYIHFMRTNTKRVKYNKTQHIGPNEVFYDIDIKKVEALGNISFTRGGTKKSVEELDFNLDFENVEAGRYMFCGYSNTIFTPVPLHLKVHDVDVFSISPVENKEFYYENNVVALTGKIHYLCNGPEVFIPDKYLTIHEARTILKDLSDKHMYNNMDSATAFRHMVNNRL